MALRSARPHILSVLLFAFILALFPGQVQADGAISLPPLEEFVDTVRNGEAEELRGIYVPEVLADQIVSQPEDDPGFVSSNDDTLTQFRLASEVGSTGLLAHNYLAGEDFFKVEEGQVLYLVYGDGHTHAFIVTRIQRFKALDPESVWSKFLDLKHGGLLSASDLFSNVYGQPGHVILQTCIRANGESSWGRLFITAEPYPVTVARANDKLVNVK